MTEMTLTIDNNHLNSFCLSIMGEAYLKEPDPICYCGVEDIEVAATLHPLTEKWAQGLCGSWVKLGRTNPHTD